jgi:hypothetical protein
MSLTAGLAIGLAAGLAGGLAAGCGGGAIEISDAPMSGRIGGVPWSLGSAETSGFLSSADQFFVEAYAEVVAPCTGAGSQVRSNRLLLKVPRETGNYLLGSGLNDTFFVQDTSANYVATQGRIVVNQVTDTMLSGGAHIMFDSNNEVDGQFQAQICPP